MEISEMPEEDRILTEENTNLCESAAENAELNKTTVNKKSSHTLTFFLVRLVVCFIIFGGVLFVKLNNPCMFENFRFWYQNNVCTEQFSADEIKKSATSLFFVAKDRFSQIISIKA